MLSVNDFTADVNNWLVHNEGCIQDESAAINNDEVHVESQNTEDIVEPHGAFQMFKPMLPAPTPPKVAPPHHHHL